MYYYCASSGGTCLPEAVVTPANQEALDDEIENGNISEYFSSGEYEDIWPGLDQEVVDKAADLSTKMLRLDSDTGDVSYYVIVDGDVTVEEFTTDDAYYTLPLDIQ